MKRILLTLSCALLIVTTYGQLPVSYLHKANLVSTANLPAKPAGGSARGISQFEVSYHDMDRLQSDADGFTFGYFGWDLNKNFDVSCTPLDTLDDNTISWAAVVFDSIYDYQTSTPYNKSTFTSMSVDTVYFLYNHVNTSGLEDTLIVSIYQVAPTAAGIALDASQKEFTNTLLWSDTLLTDVGLTPTGGTDLYFAGIPTGGVTIPAGEGFVVRLDYAGPKEDLFNLADGNRLECDNAGAASVALIANNSFRYYNGGNYTPTCSDLSGVGPLVFPSLPANCNQFYFQNFAISAVVTVDAPLSASATASEVVGCPGAFVTLNAGASGGSGDYTFTWSGNGNFTSPNSATTSVALPSGNGVETYTVTVEDNIENTTEVSTVNVTVRGITVSLGNDTTLNCGDSVLVAANTTGFLNGSQFAWSTGATTQSIFLKGGATYTVTVTNSAGCTTTDSKVVGLNVNQTVSFAASTFYNGNEDDTLVLSQNRACQSELVFFNNTSSDQSNAWSFEWDYGDQTGSVNVNGLKAYANTGVFTVTLTASDASGCIIASSPLQVQILPSNHPLCGVGIAELQLLSNISLFPNPNNGTFTVDMTNVTADDASIMVVDMMGKTVATVNTFSTTANPVQAIDMTNAANGIYFVRITANGVTATSKISVAK